MTPTPFSRSCNKTSRAFFEDFDLLPRAVKELLWTQATCPNADDLKVAWQLAAEVFSVDLLKTQLNSFEQERKEAKKAEAKAKLEAAKRERSLRLSRKFTSKNTIFGWVKRLKDTDPKQARLVLKVTEEEAMRLLTSRKENKDVVEASRTYLSWEPVAEIKKDVVEKKPVVNSLPKQWGNA